MLNKILRDEVLDVIRNAAAAKKPLDVMVGETRIRMFFTEGNGKGNALNSSDNGVATKIGRTTCPHTLIANIRAGLEEFQATLIR